jgi:hypothetical protein
MRNQRAGQATFIPLDTIQVKPVNDKFRSFARGARLAIDLVQYDESVARAIQHACGSSLICDTMDVARYVCYEKGQEVKGTWVLLNYHRYVPNIGTTVMQLLPLMVPSSTRVVSSLVAEAPMIAAKSGTRRTCKVSELPEGWIPVS